MNEIINQEVILKNRKDLEITGVKKIYSLDDREFILDSSLGKMKIEGTNLEMLQLSIDKGIISIVGNITSISYIDNIKAKTKDSSFVAKLFK